MDNVHFNGCLNMFGACIRQALLDYKIGNKNKNNKDWNKRNITIYESAKFYLFSKDGLEKQIEENGINLDISYIRMQAINGSVKLDNYHRRKYD